ncbi:MOSC domain-containing protein 1 [Actinoplanes sp. SE50]|uniref:MOSC domain-containing protein n=1 Tax=unclassified Actinoplanes TaxID=2626549 RepID=UPI00023ECB88|nr:MULTISPECIES: MOSC domain-containing protein [unclassified Actinoplanes]AEV86533.1 MOSC domain-containing protein 1 [Actinoplanes sp. SE50/110]ATO84931.1 MOSC domain-containing protein 1 [Actinoplanes sp. SE50]SLM02340.1 MOSC domain-containing protein 1 [Actinoplanes sp. SE50/110]
MGEVVWLGRYPVKSMCGEDLTEAHLDASGFEGDRRHAVLDEETGLVASAKNPRRWRALLSMAARHEPAGRVVITCPDGEQIHTDAPTADRALSRVLGRPVRLTATLPQDASMERLTPPTEPGAGTMTHSSLAAGTPGNTFVDYAAVHVITTATLDALARRHPGGRMDPRRFRPNLVVHLDDAAPFAENTWQDRTITVAGHAEIRIVTPTPRCAVPTLAQGADLPDDPDVLRTAARLNRVPVFDLGELTCVGAYGAVQRHGPLRIGDRITITRR